MKGGLAVAAITFYFTVYSFMGWLLENSYSFFTKGVFYKPNFLRGPFKPMYGFAPLILVYSITPDTAWIMVIIFCLLVPTAVEYVTGAILQKLFHRQWWDYSSMPMQLHGHICLSFSVCWFLLALISIKVIHPAMVFAYGMVEPFWSWLYLVVPLYFIAELLLAIRRHSPEGPLGLMEK